MITNDAFNAYSFAGIPWVILNSGSSPLPLEQQQHHHHQQKPPIEFTELKSNSISDLSESASFISLTNDGKSNNNIVGKKRVKVRQVRRMEANARERSRVHTISSAFENLRQVVPSYYNSYKLSKLGILRIACCYIESLNYLINEEAKTDDISIQFDEYVRKLAKTIAQESKMKQFLTEK